MPRHPAKLAAAFSLLVALLLVLSPARSFAHALDLGYLRVAAKGTTVQTSLELDSAAVARMLAIEPASLDAGTVQVNTGRLLQLTTRAGTLATEHGTCRWLAPEVTLGERTVTLNDTAECPEESHSLVWELPFVRRPELPSTFQVLVRADVFGAEVVTTLDRTKARLEASGIASVAFADFVLLGLDHIGVTPDEWSSEAGFRLPDGIDHILFVLGLVLGGGTLMGLLGTASGFTLGHTITLVIASLGLYQPPSRLVEAGIAFSIAFVAFEAFAKKPEKSRWKLATCFGLIHGFGLANALTEMDLSGARLAEALVGYNLGVELGQAIIVVLLAPPLLLVTRKAPRASGFMVPGLAALVFCAGSYWFVRRALGV